MQAARCCGRDACPTTMTTCVLFSVGWKALVKRKKESWWLWRPAGFGARLSIASRRWWNAWRWCIRPRWKPSPAPSWRTTASIRRPWATAARQLVARGLAGRRGHTRFARAVAHAHCAGPGLHALQEPDSRRAPARPVRGGERSVRSLRPRLAASADAAARGAPSDRHQPAPGGSAGSGSARARSAVAANR